MVLKSLTALLIIVAMAGPATAQRKARDVPPSPIVDALAAWRAIAENTARLACYDQASARLTEAVGKGEVIVMDQQEVKQTRRSLFGFQLPRLPLFRGDSGPDEDELTAKIVSASGIGYDKYRLRLEGNGVWETTESSSRISVPRSGQSVLIKRGPLGSYMMRIDGQRAVRAKRVE